MDELKAELERLRAHHAAAEWWPWVVQTMLEKATPEELVKAPPEVQEAVKAGLKAFIAQWSPAIS